MLAAYAPLFSVPGAKRFVVGTLFSRVGGAMFGIAVVVMLSERRGSFGLAGAVNALGLIVLAASGPLIGRLVDRYGQARVATPFIILSTSCSLIMAALSWQMAPIWTLIVAWCVSSILPEPSPMSRARWVWIFRDDPERLHTAMAFEQVADEAAFVIGPVIAILAATLWFPEAGIIMAAVLFAVGMAIFLSAESSEPPLVPKHERHGGIAILQPGVALVAGTLVMTGVIFGSNEVVAVAFADEHGSSSSSSLILGAFALGSTLSGLFLGTRPVRSLLTKRLFLAALGMVVLQAPALLAPNTVWLTAIMFVAGSVTAPMLITGFSLTQKLVPRSMVTEAMAVAVTGLLIGISIGAFAGGMAVDTFGASRAYAVPLIAGLLAVVIGSVGYRRQVATELAAGRRSAEGSAESAGA